VKRCAGASGSGVTKEAMYIQEQMRREVECRQPLRCRATGHRRSCAHWFNDKASKAGVFVADCLGRSRSSIGPPL
jgi:hypothetical protein